MIRLRSHKSDETRVLSGRVAAGDFREDLLARINPWTFTLPGLRDRPEDIGPNLDYELERVGAAMNLRLTMSREARERFLAFGRSTEAMWTGNFRDLNASVRRAATLCEGGRIGLQDIEEEIGRVKAFWRAGTSAVIDRTDAASAALEHLLTPPQLAALDRFDRVQLEEVVRVCRTARSLSDAGRVLFAASRSAKTTPNDADRLRKYLARYDLSLQAIQTA